LNVLEISDVRQINIRTAELLVPDSSPFGVEIAITTLEEYKLAGKDQILAKLIQEEVKHYCMRSMHLLILFGIRKNCLISGRSL
jgi:hypothetical protein